MNLGYYAREKKAPDFLFSCSKKFIHAFLEGLYEGDGYDRDGTWEIEIYSEVLAQQVQWLNLFLGRFTSYKTRKDRDGRIVNILAKSTNSLSPDNIPSIVGKYIRKLRKEKSISLIEMARKTRIDSSHLLRIERQKIKSIRKSSLIKMANVLGNPTRLTRLLNSDLCWLKIKEIKDLKKNEKVYDFEVKPNGKKIENFLGGNSGILLHNSGYMSDPKTQDFLDKYHEKFPHLFRKKWKSYTRAQEKKKQTRLGDY
jgi:intein/homing endonuclease